MYDRAAKITSNNVKTSIILMGTTLLRKTRGHHTELRFLRKRILTFFLITQPYFNMNTGISQYASL